MREIAFRIYLITDGEDAQVERVAAVLGALPAQSIAIQLRAPELSGRELCARAERLREVTRGRAALFVNDRIDVAISVAADGVHLPVRGIPIDRARRVSGALMIAASTHSLDEARLAVAMGADLITFGPVWPTRSHPGAPATGTGTLADVVRAFSVPVFALGGLDADRAREAFAVGARAASLGNVLGADDPIAAARAFAVAAGFV